MQTIKRISVEMGEECKVDVDIMHESLLKLPAEMYLELYHKMQAKVLGSPLWGCNCGVPAESESD